MPCYLFRIKRTKHKTACAFLPAQKHWLTQARFYVSEKENRVNYQVTLIIMLFGEFVCSIYVLVNNPRRLFFFFTVALDAFVPQPQLLFGCPGHREKKIG